MKALRIDIDGLLKMPFPMKSANIFCYNARLSENHRRYLS
jgi:hypothetical protein